MLITSINNKIENISNITIAFKMNVFTISKLLLKYHLLTLKIVKELKRFSENVMKCTSKKIIALKQKREFMILCKASLIVIHAFIGF